MNPDGPVPDRQDCATDPAHSGAAPRTTIDRVATLVEWGTVLAASAFVVAYLFVALRRLSYPFDLEWMEGSMVHHVARVLSGQPLYGPPTLDFTPFLYPPLYYFVSAAVARVTGLGFLPLRLVSIASSLVVFGLLYRLASREANTAYAGVLAVGLFAATYRVGGAWFDLARNDSLFLAFLLGAIYLLRFRESAGGWAAAGALLGLSALTKQSALIMCLPLLLYAAALHMRRAAMFGFSFAGVFGVTTMAYNRLDHGWYAYYVLRLPERIQAHAAEAAPFWTHDIARAMPLATLLAIGGLVLPTYRRDRRAAFWPVVTLSTVGAAWLSRLHSGAYDNVVIPAFACIAVLAGVAAVRIPALAGARHRPHVRLGVALLCSIQFLALHYSISDQLPTAADTALERDFGRRLGAATSVLIPFHSYVPTPGGAVMHAHSWALEDVLRSGDPATGGRLMWNIKAALDRQQYDMVVLDKIEPWMEPDLDQQYRRAGPALAGDGMWTRTGYRTQPRWIYLPRHDVR